MYVLKKLGKFCRTPMIKGRRGRSTGGQFWQLDNPKEKQIVFLFVNQHYANCISRPINMRMRVHCTKLCPRLNMVRAFLQRSHSRDRGRGISTLRGGAPGRGGRGVEQRRQSLSFGSTAIYRQGFTWSDTPMRRWPSGAPHWYYFFKNKGWLGTMTVSPCCR